MKKTSNEDYYYTLFCQWQESGKSKASFAASAGVPKQTFYYWCRKFSSDPVVSDSPSGFSIIPTDSFPVNPVAKISYPSGISVELFGSVDPDWIKALVL